MASGFEGIRLTIILDRLGCLKQLKATGHAKGRVGENIPCALISIFLRSTAWLLESHDFLVQGQAENTGDFQLLVSGYHDSDAAYLKGVTDLLLKGLWDTKEDFPSQININIMHDQ